MAPSRKCRSVWHTPHACTRTSASPGPGSGTTTVTTSTGAPFDLDTTPRTRCGMPAPSRGEHVRWWHDTPCSHRTANRANRHQTEEKGARLSLDVARARADTPGCRRVVHLNNAGASLPARPVLEAVIDHLRLEAEIGGYEAAAARQGETAHTYDALARLVDARVKLIAISHVPTHNGLVNPAVEVGRAAREAGVTYLLDACQSVGQMPVDVAEIGCDLLSATGRKFLRGPRGTGFLFVSGRLLDRLDPPFLDLHAATWTGPGEFEVRPDARRFESWESSPAARIGLGVAADYALGLGLDAIGQRVTALAERLRGLLGALPGVTVHDRGARRCGIVTFSVEGHEAGEVAAALARRRINVSQSPPEAARYDFEARGLPVLVRASVHYYNTTDELEALCSVVERLVSSPARPGRTRL